MQELMDYTIPGLTYSEAWLKLYKKAFVSPVVANDQHRSRHKHSSHNIIFDTASSYIPQPLAHQLPIFFQRNRHQHADQRYPPCSPPSRLYGFRRLLRQRDQLGRPPGCRPPGRRRVVRPPHPGRLLQPGADQGQVCQHRRPARQLRGRLARRRRPRSRQPGLPEEAKGRDPWLRPRRPEDYGGLVVQVRRTQHPPPYLPASS